RRNAATVLPVRLLRDPVGGRALGRAQRAGNSAPPEDRGARRRGGAAPPGMQGHPARPRPRKNSGTINKAFFTPGTPGRQGTARAGGGRAPSVCAEPDIYPRDSDQEIENLEKKEKKGLSGNEKPLHLVQLLGTQF